MGQQQQGNQGQGQPFNFGDQKHIIKQYGDQKHIKQYMRPIDENELQNAPTINEEVDASLMQQMAQLGGAGGFEDFVNSPGNGVQPRSNEGNGRGRQQSYDDSPIDFQAITEAQQQQQAPIDRKRLATALFRSLTTRIKNIPIDDAKKLAVGLADDVLSSL